MKEKKHPFAIKKRGLGQPCVFYNDGCMIYETRPQICRDYPGDGHCIREKTQKIKEGNKEIVNGQV